jgi:hypothetical protein
VPVDLYLYISILTIKGPALRLTPLSTHEGLQTDEENL